jgi:hypothetical protein
MKTTRFEIQEKNGSFWRDYFKSASNLEDAKRLIRAHRKLNPKGEFRCIIRTEKVLSI